MDRHLPRRGDKVNDRSRIPHANGFIQQILYDDGPSEVVVRFEDGVETYDYDTIRYSWTEGYGGVFIIT